MYSLLRLSLPILTNSTVDCRTRPSQQRSRDGAQHHQIPRGGAGQPPGRLGSQHGQTMSFGHRPFPYTIFLDRRYLLPFDNTHSTVPPEKERSRQFVSYSIRLYTLSLPPLLRIPPIHSFFLSHHVLVAYTAPGDFALMLDFFFSLLDPHRSAPSLSRRRSCYPCLE